VNGQHIDSVVLPSIPFNAYEGSRPVEIWPAKMRGFVDAIRTNGPAPVPGEEIIYNQAICDGIYRSSKLKKEVEIVMPSLD
jgi:predicted dehydrogenase